MQFVSASGWKRGWAMALILAASLFLGAPTRGRSDDTPKKPDAPKAKDDAKSEEPAVGAPSGGAVQTAEINRLLAKFWADNSAKPADKATDYEFCRRAYLDILGRVPAIWEVKDYVANTSRKKREQLIHKLLHDPYYKEEYEENWSTIWTTLLLTRSGNKIYHEQMHEWLADQFGKNAPWDQMVRELLTAKGENNDNGAVNFVLAHLGDPQQARESDGQFDMVPITSRTTRLFLGLQIQCTQCHNHPFNPEWKQSHFWGVNAFFRQVERDGTPLMRQQANMPNAAAKLKLNDRAEWNKDGKVFFEDRQAVMHQTAPKFLDGKKLTDGKFNSRRDALAQFIIDHDQFPKAFVNRMWGHFFGRGLNQNATVDDFGEHNQVVHPELLEVLAKGFKDYKYNIKELISWICNSEAYDLSCKANNSNNKPEHEVYFSRMLLKNMSPEQLFESLRTVLDQPVKPKTGEVGKKTAAMIAAMKDAYAKRKKERDAWLAKLTRNFGDDEGNEITFNGTVVQALLMMNGKELQAELSRPMNNTALIAMKPPQSSSTLNELTIAALGRKATDKEKEVLKRERITGDPVWFWQDVLWALLNSNEFVLNH
jgi:hypothetical protein